MTASCGAPEDERLNCDDLLPASDAGFARVAELVTSRGPTGCAACHNTKQPLMGMNLEGPAVAYDVLKHKMALVYPQLESGLMPPFGIPWTEDQLRLVRSWYCHGGLYEEP